ncbi:hypothetical protein HDU92_007037 [Lobulomyces angularis]|nr:hypothetical protein HDU92_007037 [Lobulomyces angularis]
MVDIPINKEDLPKSVFRLIQSSLRENSEIVSCTKPKANGSKDRAWGLIGSNSEPIHFRTSAKKTFSLLGNDNKKMAYFNNWKYVVFIHVFF